MTDTEREIRYAPEEKPGVSNLLEIMSVATGDPIPELERRFDGSGYGDLKEAVGESVVALLTPIRERFEALRADEGATAAARRRRGEGAARGRADTGADVRPDGIRAAGGRAVLRGRPASRSLGR